MQRGGGLGTFGARGRSESGLAHGAARESAPLRARLRRSRCAPGFRVQPGGRGTDVGFMLMCHACNTRFEEGVGACPSCGRRASEHAVEVGATTAGALGSTLPPAHPMEAPVDRETTLEEREIVNPVLEGEVSPPSVRRKREPLLALSRDSAPAALKLANRQVS